MLGQKDSPISPLGRCSGFDTVSITSEIDSILEDYERVNHVISFFQDERARRWGLEEVGRTRGVGLELGSGPGNFTRMLRPYIGGPLVCLDFSEMMLDRSRRALRGSDLHRVRGVFENLPFRSGVFSLTASAYALRDSTEKVRALREVRRTQGRGGKTLLVDVGKPSNPVVRGFFTLYMRYLMPFLGGYVAGYGYPNPWVFLYETFALLPVNSALLGLMQTIFGRARLNELAFGGLVVAIAEKTGF
jgi:demethylmenaquinone methyltransferase/2-methoxy-6-polyprenyl-1,4-benzoquinol methylase